MYNFNANVAMADMDPVWRRQITADLAGGHIHHVQELAFPPECNLVDVGIADEPDYCAVYVTAATNIQLEIVLYLPDLSARIPPPAVDSEISLHCTVETLRIKTSTVNGAPNSGAKVRRPAEQNDTFCDALDLQLPTRVLSVAGQVMTCEVTLEARWTEKIGVVFVSLCQFTWQGPVGGPSGGHGVDDPMMPCEQPNKRQKANEAGDARIARVVALDRELRVALLRLVDVPNQDLLPLNGVPRFVPFASYRHLLHACLWANQSSQADIDSPHGLVYQIVQNVREYHGRWKYGYMPALFHSQKKIQPIPYPTDDVAAPSYDVRNEGWNVLDNPDGGRVGAQCNQLATLYLDVLGTLGFKTGEVIDLERIYTVHNGTTTIRHMMKGYSVHGLLCVQFARVDWCYDSTMSVPPVRWYNTLAEAKQHKPFIKFDGDTWRYLTYKGHAVPEVLAADHSCRPLVVHLPTDGAGTSRAGGIWHPGKGHIPYSGPGQPRDGSADLTEAALEQQLDRLRIEVMCDNNPSEGYWVDGTLHFIVPQLGVAVVARAVKSGGGDLGAVKWQVDGRPAGVGVSAEVPRAAAARLELVASLGAETSSVVVWVVWAQMKIQITGTLPADCPQDIDFKHAKATPPTDELRQLGVLAKRGCAVGRMVAIAALQPAEVRQVKSAQWKMRRTIPDEWTERDNHVDARDIRLNRNDQPEPNTRMYNNQPTLLGKLYLCDAPSMELDGAAIVCKTRMQFDQWLELEGLVFSNHADWTYCGAKHKDWRSPKAKLWVGNHAWDGDEGDLA